MNDDTSLGDIFKMMIGVAVIGVLGHGIVKYFKCDTSSRISLHFGIFIIAGLVLGAVIASLVKDKKTSWFDEYLKVTKWTCLIALLGWVIFGGVRGCIFDEETHSEIMGDKSKYEGTDTHGPQPYPGESSEHYLKRVFEDSLKEGH